MNGQVQRGRGRGRACQTDAGAHSSTPEQPSL